jgi:recombination protein RecA
MGDILNKAISDLNKIYGQGTVIQPKDDYKVVVETLSSGSLALDKALGVGGYPVGRIVEIYGPESSGKTTLALHLIKEAQLKHSSKTCLFVDMEHALSPSYAQSIGIDIENWLFSQPSCGEEALEIIEKLLKTGEISVVVLDSVAALIPKAELDGDYGESKMGLQARLMGQAMRKLTGLVSKSNCILVFINQIREKIGVMFGNPETTTGGNALKFYASVRLEVRKGAKVKDGENIDGNLTKVKIIKNKVSPPFKECEFEIKFGVGIDRLGELIDICVENSVLTKSGSFFSYGDIKLGQGREQVRELLKDNEELVEELNTQCRMMLGLEEVTEEIKIKMAEMERARVWSNFEDRLEKIVEKYKLDAVRWVESIKDGYDEKVYRAMTDFQISQVIKKFNEV